jgi:hypothetical protein
MPHGHLLGVDRQRVWRLGCPKTALGGKSPEGRLIHGRSEHSGGARQDVETLSSVYGMKYPVGQDDGGRAGVLREKNDRRTREPSRNGDLASPAQPSTARRGPLPPSSLPRGRLAMCTSWSALPALRRPVTSPTRPITKRFRRLDFWSICANLREMMRRGAVRLIKKAAADRRLIFTSHALDEMDAEGETRESVAAALQHARSFALQKNGRWQGTRSGAHRDRAG